MAKLAIRIKRNHDGSAVLTCTRADGTATWHRQPGRQGAFFPLHDLTHYAVETVLRLREGFYGLLAAGWAVSDFGAPWPRGPLPPDAARAELIVGFLDTERAAGHRWTAAEFNELYVPAHGIPALDDDTLGRMRALRSRLFEQWRAVPPGGSLTLEYERPPAPARSPAPLARGR